MQKRDIRDGVAAFLITFAAATAVMVGYVWWIGRM